MATPSVMPMRIIRKSLLDTRWASRTPCSRTITTVQHSLNTEPIPELLHRARAHPIPERELATTPKPPAQPSTRPKGRKAPYVPPPAIQRTAPEEPFFQHVDKSIDASIRQLLPLLKAQAPHYLRTHIHGKPYLVTAGDTIRLPFLMHGVLPGDVLRLNRATLLGSRDYTLKPGTASQVPSKNTSMEDEELDGRGLQPLGFIDERLFTCRARVMGTELEPMRIKEKTKRRQRHIRKIRSKHAYTVLRVMEIGVSEVEEVGKAASAQSSPEPLDNDDKAQIEELVERTAKVVV